MEGENQPTLHQLVPPEPNIAGGINWDAVRARTICQPEEASKQYHNSVDDDGTLVLHTVVRCNPPLEAACAVVNAYPDALDKYTYCEGESPLSYACKNGASPQVIRMLVRRTVDVLRKKESADNAIQFFNNEDISVEVKKIVIEEYPNGALQHLGDDCNLLIKMMGDFDLYHKWSKATRKNKWETLQLLLVAAQRGSTHSPISPDKEYRPLHTLLHYCLREGESCVERCANNFVNVFLETELQDPAQFCRRNESGDLPLHTLLKERNVVCDEGSTSACRLIQIFLRAHPDSARTTDCNGRLPLHLAIENLWPIDAILAAEPRALQTRDIRTKFYPFQAAWLRLCLEWNFRRRSTSESPTSLMALDMTFRLLQEDPNMLRFRGR